ncbi:hypothetical protein Trydic_g15775 [Trypoxylus dichotomus]
MPAREGTKRALLPEVLYLNMRRRYYRSMLRKDPDWNFVNEVLCLYLLCRTAVAADTCSYFIRAVPTSTATVERFEWGTGCEDFGNAYMYVEVCVRILFGEGRNMFVCEFIIAGDYSAYRK